MNEEADKTTIDKYKCILPINSMPFVAEAGTGKVMKPYRHMDRQADFNVMIYITEGSMEIIEEGKSWLITKGDLFFLKKGLHHLGHKPFEIGTSWHYAHFYTQDVSSSMYNMEDHEPLTGMPLLVSEDSFEAFITIPKITRIREGSSLERAVLALTKIQSSERILDRNLLMWKILKDTYDLAHTLEASGRESKWLEELVSYIELHYDEKLSMDMIQKRFGLTYKYMGKCFKDKTGLTIKAYQKNLRLQRASTLLGETQLSISEIADRIGYGDLFYFSKLFKETYGSSPSFYRKHYLPRL